MTTAICPLTRSFLFMLCLIVGYIFLQRTMRWGFSRMVLVRSGVKHHIIFQSIVWGYDIKLYDDSTFVLRYVSNTGYNLLFVLSIPCLIFFASTIVTSFKYIILTSLGGERCMQGIVDWKTWERYLSSKPAKRLADPTQ